MNTDFYNMQLYMTFLKRYATRNYTMYVDITETNIVDLIANESFDADNINTLHTVEEMTADDIAFVATLLKSDLCDDGLIIVRYDELASYNSEVLAKTQKRTGLGLFDIYHGLLREARSYVYDMVNNTTASVPFYKFMNIDQCEGYSSEEVYQRVMNANRVEYTEKMDGCFVQMFRHGGRNYLSTACSIGREHETTGSAIRDAIVKYLEKNNDLRIRLLKMITDYSDYTFMFEAILPETHIIVNYDKEDYGLYLIGARHNVIGTLQNRSWLEEMADDYDIQMPHVYFCKIVSKTQEFIRIREELKQAKGTEQEGVVANIDGFLVKMKSDDYFKLVGFKKAMGSMDVIIKAYGENQLDDLIATAPDSAIDNINKVVSEISEYNNMCDNAFRWYLKEAYQEDVGLKDVQSFVKGCPKCIKTVVSDALYRTFKKEPQREWNYLWRKGSSASGQHSYMKYSELKDSLDELKEFMNDKG